MYSASNPATLEPWEFRSWADVILRRVSSDRKANVIVVNGALAAQAMARPESNRQADHRG